MDISLSIGVLSPVLNRSVWFKDKSSHTFTHTDKVPKCSWIFYRPNFSERIHNCGDINLRVIEHSGFKEYIFELPKEPETIHIEDKVYLTQEASDLNDIKITTSGETGLIQGPFHSFSTATLVSKDQSRIWGIKAEKVNATSFDTSEIRARFTRIGSCQASENGQVYLYNRLSDPKITRKTTENGKCYFNE